MEVPHQIGRLPECFVGLSHVSRCCIKAVRVARKAKGFVVYFFATLVSQDRREEVEREMTQQNMEAFPKARRSQLWVRIDLQEGRPVFAHVSLDALRAYSPLPYTSSSMSLIPSRSRRGPSPATPSSKR